MIPDPSVFVSGYCLLALTSLWCHLHKMNRSEENKKLPVSSLSSHFGAWPDRGRLAGAGYCHLVSWDEISWWSEQPLTITFHTFLSQDYDNSEARITQPTKAINEERRFDKLRLRYENISKLKIIVFGLSDWVCAGIMTDQLIIFSNIQHRGVGNKSLIHILRA